MKNPVIFYLVIAVGVIVLGIGGYYLFKGGHPLREYTGLAVGVVLLIAGIAGSLMTRSKAAA